MERLNLRFCRTFLVFLLGLFVSVGAFAQKISVTGVVKDEAGLAVIGGSVYIKGTTTGVITDVDGKFSLSANKGDILVFSYVGFVTQEVPASEEPLNIILREDAEMLIRRHPKTMSSGAYINIITFTRCPICRPDSLHTSKASTSPRAASCVDSAARFPFRFKKKNTTTHWRNQGQCTPYPVGQSHGIAGGYPRPCPEISPSLLADISVHGLSCHD